MTIEDTQKAVEAFTRQEAEFRVWIKSYYEAAFNLDWLKRHMSKAAWRTWLAKNFRSEQIEVVNQMLHQLHTTDIGTTILATVTHPENFIFPQ